MYERGEPNRYTGPPFPGCGRWGLSLFPGFDLVTPFRCVLCQWFAILNTCPFWPQTQQLPFSPPGRYSYITTF